MLLDSIEALNARGDKITLSLPEPAGGILVKDVAGLGPVKATIVSSAFANMDGEQFYSSRREKRNIVVKLGLAPDFDAYSAQDLRNQLYQYFMPKSWIDLAFISYDPVEPDFTKQYLRLEITGVVESIEPDLFTNEPQVSLSVLCMDADFCQPGEVVFDGMTTSDLTETEFEYEGTVETGFLFELPATRDIDDLAIYVRGSDNKVRTFQLDHLVQDTDVLKVNSVFGDKHVLLNEGGVDKPILYSVTPGSSWLELMPGPNHVRVYSAGTPVPYSIKCVRKYGGL